MGQIKQFPWECESMHTPTRAQTCRPPLIAVLCESSPQRNALTIGFVSRAATNHLPPLPQTRAHASSHKYSPGAHRRSPARYSRLSRSAQTVNDDITRNGVPILCPVCARLFHSFLCSVAFVPFRSPCHSRTVHTLCHRQRVTSRRLRERMRAFHRIAAC